MEFSSRNIATLMMSSVLVVSFASCSLFSKFNGNTLPEGYLKTKADTISYAYGVLNGAALRESSAKMPNAGMLRKDIMMMAFNQAYQSQQTLISVDSAEKVMTDFVNKSVEQGSAKVKQRADSLIEVHKKMKDVVTLPSGLQYVVLKEGFGEKPKMTDVVTLYFKGQDVATGKEFANTFTSQRPLTTPMSELITGIAEGVALMRPGAKYQFFVPYSMAYGAEGVEGINPYSNLLLEVELLRVGDTKAQNPDVNNTTPEDVSAKALKGQPTSNVAKDSLSAAPADAKGSEREEIIQKADTLGLIK